MTSSLPPKVRDTRDRDALLRHNKTNLKQLGVGFVGGRFPPARPLGSAASSGDNEDDDGDDLLLFENRDTGTATGANAPVRIRLSHIPEDGSEQVFYNGIALKRTDWTRTDSVLTIPGEPWFRAGKVAWVDYAYYDAEPDTEPAAFVVARTIFGTNTSIAVPGTPNAGDLFVLVMHGRDAATCSDPRFTVKNADPGGKWGIWVGTDDGTSDPVAINLLATTGSGDGAGALMRITGAPLPVTSEQSTPSTSGSPFTPAVPSAGALGVMAIISGTSVASGYVSDDVLGHWTTRALQQGSGTGFTSVYLGTAVGIPAGQWQNTGGSPFFAAWAGGLQ